MNQKAKFITFLESIKGNDNLINTFKEAFNACLEADTPSMEYISVEDGITNSLYQFTIILEMEGYYKMFKENPNGDDDQDVLEFRGIKILVERVAGDDRETIQSYTRKVKPSQLTREDLESMLTKEAKTLTNKINNSFNSTNKEFTSLFSESGYELN